jgi:NAD(P)-dependent dehydrogenase (short-subunit alcohol dehydrogenase family)
VEPPRPEQVSQAPRVAAVLGASGVLGSAIVDALLARDWAVVGFDTVPASAGHSVVLDPCDRQAVQREVDAAAAELGEIECLIAVSGLEQPTPVAQITTSAWRTALQSQLLSAANFAWAVLPAMLRRGAGNIVTVGSDVALGAPGGDAAQAAAAGAVIGFAKALAIELAKTGVQVNAISAQLSEDQGDASTPLGRPVLAGEIAATAAYLADERHFFLGQILSPNGGRVI